MDKKISRIPLSLLLHSRMSSVAQSVIWIFDLQNFHPTFCEIIQNRKNLRLIRTS
jgi:hypothetical protein